MEMLLDQKQIWMISYLTSKWDIKQQKQLATSTTHLAQELLTKAQRDGGSRSFAEETRALKMRSAVAGHQKLTTTNPKQSSKLIFLELHEKLFNLDHSTVVWHLKQIGKMKRLN